MGNRFFLVCIYIVITLLSYANDKLYFSNLGLKDGLSQISVLDILQDNNGYMWFATRNGLNRYDGNDFLIFRNELNDSLSLTNNHVLCIEEDKRGNIWIGTIHGLNKLDTRTNKITAFKSDYYSNILSRKIKTLYVDSRNRLWIGGYWGFCLYDLENEKFNKSKYINTIKSKPITTIKETKDGKIVLGTKNNGIYILDLDLNLLDNLTMSSKNIKLQYNYISDVCEDDSMNIWISYNNTFVSRINLKNNSIDNYNIDIFKNRNYLHKIVYYQGNLIIGTLDGLLYLNPLTGKVSFESSDPSQLGNLPHFSTYSLYVDRNNTLWVGTYSNGVSFANKINNRFKFHNPNFNNNSQTTVFGDIAYHKEKGLFIATESSGILQYNPKLDNKYNIIYLEKNKIYHQNIVKSILLEGDIIWCGTAKGIIYKINLKTMKSEIAYSLPKKNSVYEIIRSKTGDLWVVLSDPLGIMKLTSSGNVIKDFHYKGDVSSIKNCRCIYELSEGIFLVGTNDMGLIRYNDKNGETIQYNVNGASNKHLLSDYITDIYADRSGRIWISTFGGGVALYKDGVGIIKRITKEDGLIDNQIYSIVEDSLNNIWFSSVSGISMYNPNEEEFNNYYKNNGIDIEEFTLGSSILLPSGEIIFGGNNGFLSFAPTRIAKNSYPPSIVLNDLFINNELVLPFDETKILNRVLNYTDSITLKYNQNNLSVSYSALNYIYPKQNRYAAFLHGYDKRWQLLDGQTRVFYTNLSPGRYELELKASNNDGLWQNDSKSLYIEIEPPIWRTWYAYVVYMFVFIALITFIIYYTIRKKSLEKELVYQKKLKQHIEESNNKRIRMFTNFSHELRTPLTLIVAPLQELVKIQELPLYIKNKLNVVNSNSHRLLLLVNQLLDLRKNQEEKQKLHISKSNMVTFISEIYIAFQYLAVQKNINLTYNNSDVELYAWFDKSILEKILFNLLSNAIKFTPSSGNVSIALRKLYKKEMSIDISKEFSEYNDDMEFAVISVMDDGNGIPDDELNNIFEPFYQISNTSSNTIGTGVGLSLTLAIVKSHNGYIAVHHNEPNGTVFTVYIPISSSAYSDKDICNDKTVSDEIILSDKKHEVNKEKKNKTILIVEDNDDVRTFLIDYLGEYYNILSTNNGKYALDITNDKYPDLVLSDIMMPVMNGLELCKNIKSNYMTEHIPVVLMTARTMVDDVKEGYSVGADDYILKPFSIDLLLTRLDNIFLSRDRLRELYGRKFSLDNMGIKIVSNNDSFTQRLFEIIEKNLTNPDLGVDLLCCEIGISRANLYRKIKALTDLPLTEIIRNKRLEIAAKLLLESSLSITEVAYNTGFNSPGYFTHCFRNFYGYSPSEWVTSHKENMK